MRKHLYVDNKDLADFGVYITGSGTFGSPEKEVTTYAVPGRNGLVLGSTARLENIQVTYPCFIYTNFDQNMRDLRSFLLSREGYVRITDDYDTTHFRKGFFEAGISPDMTAKLDAGQFDLVFNCMPQRWLLGGETTHNIDPTERPVVYWINLTRFPAYPLIRIYGYGTLDTSYWDSGQGQAVSVKIVVAQHSEAYVDVDCETMQVYCGNKNMSQYVDFQRTENGQTIYNVDAPFIPPNGVSLATEPLDATITAYDMTSRTWEV